MNLDKLWGKLLAKIDTTKYGGLGIHRLHPSVLMPEKATPGSACFDLRFHRAGKASYTVYGDNNRKEERFFSDDGGVIKIYKGERVLVPTGIIFDIPEHFSLRIHIRSSVALKYGVFLANSEAVIDSDYVEESYIMLYNSSSESFVISESERIAQAELVPVCDFSVRELYKLPLRKTIRESGFGSTGTS